MSMVSKIGLLFKHARVMKWKMQGLWSQAGRSSYPHSVTSWLCNQPVSSIPGTQVPHLQNRNNYTYLKVVYKFTDTILSPSLTHNGHSVDASYFFPFDFDVSCKNDDSAPVAFIYEPLQSIKFLSSHTFLIRQSSLNTVTSHNCPHVDHFNL